MLCEHSGMHALPLGSLLGSDSYYISQPVAFTARTSLVVNIMFVYMESTYRIVCYIYGQTGT